MVDYWVQRGPFRSGPGDLLEPADGWSATLDEHTGSRTVANAGGDVALTGWFDPARDADWVNTVRDTGELVVLTGRVAPEGGTITAESLQAAVDSDDVARGTITRITIR
ncbi:hypothetical protein [Microlunatus ginsengisoli]|uniref:Uncharacterized protein n=1 Tax=Microlunatus ginsengisoli TaxID=363863 RepID=A0ABP7ALM9_9ACTN